MSEPENRIVRYLPSPATGTPVTSMLYDDLDVGPLREPYTHVLGHKVYRKESCTHDHQPVKARRYFGLWQCAACYGIIAPSLRKLTRLRLDAYHEQKPHTNGNGNGKRAA